MSAELDLVIRGGTDVDGTGRDAFEADVGVSGNRIVEIGAIAGKGAEEIDARGKLVTPGFVDIHTHYDGQAVWDSHLAPSSWHGVTTVVMGNCGFGVAPTRRTHRDLIVRTLEKVEGMSIAALEAGMGEDWGFETFPEYLDAIALRGTAINVGVMIGHTPLRLYVMGEAATERAATTEEVVRMCALVGEALDAGAIGFATSNRRPMLDMAAVRCRAAPPISPRSARSPARWARPGAACCRRPRVKGCCSTSSRRSRARPAPM
ncbi:MAG TPA: amidohydrolase family protein [Stellaceae bacterium]